MFIGKLARELFKSTKRKGHSDLVGTGESMVAEPALSGSWNGPKRKPSVARSKNASSRKRDNHGRFARKK